MNAPSIYQVRSGPTSVIHGSYHHWQPSVSGLTGLLRIGRIPTTRASGCVINSHLYSTKASSSSVVSTVHVVNLVAVSRHISDKFVIQLSC